MKFNKNIKIALFGAIIWTIIFIIGSFLYTAKGLPILSPVLTQLIFVFVMLLLSAAAALYLLNTRKGQFIREGAVIGLIWIVMHCALDYFVLLPLRGITADIWLQAVALSYLTLPVLTMAMGAAFNVGWVKHQNLN